MNYTQNCPAYPWRVTYCQRNLTARITTMYFGPHWTDPTGRHTASGRIEIGLAREDQGSELTPAIYEWGFMEKLRYWRSDREQRMTLGKRVELDWELARLTRNAESVIQSALYPIRAIRGTRISNAQLVDLLDPMFEIYRQRTRDYEGE
jgi:hypothetical protein